jgi:hypothetical protein
MLDQLSNLNPHLNGGEFLGMIAIIGGITVWVIKVLTLHNRKTQLDEMEATLKMEMIQRGMSASEIKQVLEANMGGARRVNWKDEGAHSLRPGKE